MIIQTSDSNDKKFLIDFEGFTLTVYSYTGYSDHVEKKVYTNISFNEKDFEVHFLEYLYKSFNDLQHEYNCILASYENAEFCNVLKYEDDLKILRVVSEILYGKGLI